MRENIKKNFEMITSGKKNCLIKIREGLVSN